MKVAAAILAAGASTRLGAPKQLVSLKSGGERLLERAVRIAVAAGCEPVVVVLGARAEEIQIACSLAGARVVLNEDWAGGMASSVHAAVGALPVATEGLVLMTCDQPAVTAEHLIRLITAGQEAAEVVGSRYSAAGKIGVPAFFPAGRFADLSGLRGDQGARSLLTTSRTVELPGGEVDVDTAEALAQARAMFGEA